MAKKKVVIQMVIVAVALALGLGYIHWQNMQQQLVMQQVSHNNKTIPTPSDEFTNWKIYQNIKYGFSFKYPADFSIDFSNAGFASGSDYYGQRDFNFLINNPKIEPSYEGPINNLTGKPSRQFDGYNFAIFSGDSSTKQLSNLSDIVKNGNHYSPVLQKTYVTILGNNYPLYYKPPSRVPHTDDLSYWFVSFPLGNSTVIVTGNYDQKLLIDILSTFQSTQ
jgi:hypothetical protein